MGYEKMRVYQAAELLRCLTDELRSHLRGPFFDEFRHVDEAVDSVLNNLAEGSDSIYPGKKLNFFDIARNSSNEAGNGLRSLGNRKAFGTKPATKAVTLAYTIRKMIAALIEHLEENDPKPTPKPKPERKPDPKPNPKPKPKPNASPNASRKRST